MNTKSTFHSGNYNELFEIIEPAKQGKIIHSIQEFPLTEINQVADKLMNVRQRAGQS